MSIKEIFPSAALPEARGGGKEMLSKKKDRGRSKKKVGSPSPLRCNITTSQSRPYFKPLSVPHAIITRCLSCTLFRGGILLLATVISTTASFLLSYDSLKSCLTFNRACLRRHHFLRLSKGYINKSRPLFHTLKHMETLYQIFTHILA